MAYRHLPSGRTAFAAFGILLSTSLSLLGCAPEAGSTDDNFTEKQVVGRSLPKGTIALTFDDGPGTRTAELAQYLNDNGIPAGFFMMGIHAQGQDALIDQLIGLGHVVGNHTWDHPLLTKLSLSSVTSEVQKTDDVLSSHFFGNMRLFRAPFGGWSPKIADSLNETQLASYVGSIFWDIGGDLTSTHAADWACWSHGLSVQECGDRYMNEIRDRGRGIVLMHDTHSKTIDMVKYILPILINDGWNFVRVDQVPDINAQLIANGSEPLPAVGTTTKTTPPQPQCGDDGLQCGQAADGSPALVRCTKHQLQTVCPCSDTCDSGNWLFDASCTCVGGD